MKKIMLAMILLGSISSIWACKSIKGGNYFCINTDRVFENVQFDYGEDLRGKFVTFSNEDSRFYLDAKPSAMNYLGEFLDVVSRCSEDQKSLHINMNIYGLGEMFGEVKIVSLGKGRISFSKKVDGNNSSLVCLKSTK